MNGTQRVRRLAFTLIELLIVVAIIAILAAIAVPNFLEAQVRAKVSRVQSDMRSMALAIEAYAVDWNRYPRARTWPHLGGQQYNLRPLSARIMAITTPVSYITSLPLDIFTPTAGWNGKGGTSEYDLQFPDFDTFDYFDSDSDRDEDNHATDSTRGAAWRLASSGPDLWGSFGIVWTESKLGSGNRQGFDYDPTNGTVSHGDIVRLGSTKRAWDYDLALSAGATEDPPSPPVVP